MKTFFTKHLLHFALFAAVLTLIFRYFLEMGIVNKSNLIVVISAVGYFLAMFFIGWFFGKKDTIYLPINDIGFRFHLTTYMVHNTISIIWVNYTANLHDDKSVYITASIWGFLLFIHFVIYIWNNKNSIEGLNKEDLFD